MDVTPLLQAGQKIIQAYSAGRLKVSGEYFDGPVIVSVFGVRPWPLSCDDPFDIEPFLAIQNECDIVLIGSGKKAQLMLPDKRAAFRGIGMAVDVMDTGAACRTFNVLTAEGRRVAAALMPFKD